jgi:hypothetical protein
LKPANTIHEHHATSAPTHPSKCVGACRLRWQHNTLTAKTKFEFVTFLILMLYHEHKWIKCKRENVAYDCTFLQRFEAQYHHSLGVFELRSHPLENLLLIAFKKLHSFLKVTTSMMHFCMLLNIIKIHFHQHCKKMASIYFKNK